MDGPPVHDYAPLTEPPTFYRVDYDTTDAPLVQEGVGGFDFIVTPRLKITIWGRKVGSPFAEDQQPLADAEQRGYIMGEWFSTISPEGELGTHHASGLNTIPEHEFNQAWKRGWVDEKA
jgi:hypothetical protein